MNKLSDSEKERFTRLARWIDEEDPEFIGNMNDLLQYIVGAGNPPELTPMREALIAILKATDDLKASLHNPTVWGVLRQCFIEWVDQGEPPFEYNDFDDVAYDYWGVGPNLGVNRDKGQSC